MVHVPGQCVAAKFGCSFNHRERKGLRAIPGELAVAANDTLEASSRVCSSANGDIIEKNDCLRRKNDGCRATAGRRHPDREGQLTFCVFAPGFRLLLCATGCVIPHDEEERHTVAVAFAYATGQLLAGACADSFGPGSARTDSGQALRRCWARAARSILTKAPGNCRHSRTGSRTHSFRRSISARPSGSGLRS